MDKQHRKFRKSKTPSYNWLITNDLNTNIASCGCTYDRIIILTESELDVNSSGVFRFDDQYDLSYDKAKDVSDHYPV